MLFLCQTDRINLVHVPYNLIHLNEAYFYLILHTWLCSTLQKCLMIKIDSFCTWYILSSEINTVYPYELEALTRGHIVCFERKLNLELYFKIYDSSFMFFLHYTNHTDWVIWIFCNKYWKFYSGFSHVFWENFLFYLNDIKMTLKEHCTMYQYMKIITDEKSLVKTVLHFQIEKWISQ